MEKINLSNDLSVSRLVHGYWRLLDWNLSDRELIAFIDQVYESGITTFDHADIYGNHECEKKFGDALILKKDLRNNIQIITKCGIKLNTGKFPERQIKFYEYSSDYIINSANQSLKNFRTDYIDLLLLHRPAPFFDPEDVAKAFSALKKSGKVLNFGVSNFSPAQYEMLNSYLEQKLVTNQVEISPYCLDSFENGNMEFFLKNKINPMAWSPLAGGQLFKPKDDKAKRIHKQLNEVAKELNVDGIDKVIFSWLFKHPSGIVSILGSGKIDRLKSAVDSLSIDMSLEQWYKIYIAAKGEELP